MGDWTNKFKQKLQAKEAMKQDSTKKFKVYRDSIEALFLCVENKVKNIEEITVSRKLVAQTSQGISGPNEMIKILLLRCALKYIEFNPEGINLDTSHGRIRFKQNSSLGQFVYLHLVIDPNSTANYPDNLIWVYNAKGDNMDDYASLPEFDEVLMEEIIERCFLEYED